MGGGGGGLKDRYCGVVALLVILLGFNGWRGRRKDRGHSIYILCIPCI